MNTSLPENQQLKFSFFSEQLNEGSVKLAGECNTVWYFDINILVAL